MTVRTFPTNDRIWIAALVSAVLVIVGSITPWITVPQLSLSTTGTANDNDGILTVIFGALAIASLVVLHDRRSIAAGLGLLALGVATYNVVRVLQVQNPLIDINLGWGLLLTFASTIALVICACIGTPMQLPGRAPKAGSSSSPTLSVPAPVAPQKPAAPAAPVPSYSPPQSPLAPYGRPHGTPAPKRSNVNPLDSPSQRSATTDVEDSP
jgi:hypothetical protein